MTARRRWVGLGLALLLPLAATALGLTLGGAARPWGALLLHVVVVLSAGVVGGFGDAVVAGLLCSGLVAWFFIPPLGSIGSLAGVLTVALFLTVAITVGILSERAARLAKAAGQLRDESLRLAALARTTLAGGDAVPVVLEHARDMFDMAAASLLRRSGERWAALDGVGDDQPESVEEADVVLEVREDLLLALRGRSLLGAERAASEALAAHLRYVIDLDTVCREMQRVRRFDEHDRSRAEVMLRGLQRMLRHITSARASAEELRRAIGETHPALAVLQITLRDMAEIVSDEIEALDATGVVP